MSLFIPSRIELDAEILQLIEAISRRQGELFSHPHTFLEAHRIESVATIDAVHFSTKIEGNALTRDQVTQALESKGKTKVPQRDLREVLSYSRARRMARDWSVQKRPFGDTWVLEHHAELLKGIVRGRLRGHYRQAQCVIKDSKTHSIIYMAPEWQDVPGLMSGLLSWLRKQSKAGASPLLLAAQFHFEFVTIHPFMDGNGRLARLLTNGILLLGGYGVERYAALEKQHEKDRRGYYHALRTLQAANFYDIPPKQNIASWVSYWLRCLLATYDEALSRVTASAGVSFRLSEDLPQIQEDRIRKAESLFIRHKKLKAAEYADLSGLARTQAVADLNALVESGFLERVGGGRSIMYRIRKI